MTSVPFNEIQKLEPSAIIEMFVLDATAQGAGIFHFHAGTNELNQDLTWQGQVYVRFPVMAQGFEFSGSGPAPRPKLSVSNIMSGITALLLSTDDLIGAKITRKRTLKKYLDAVNFAYGVNPTADPTVEFPPDIYYIDRKVSESRRTVDFELVSALDLQGLQLPRRQIIQNSCAWKYRGSECGYTGTACFTSDDKQTNDSSADVCGKRLSSCKARFGSTAELPYGGFPGADLFKGG
jgi:lambda family phage minor tail protein L